MQQLLYKYLILNNRLNIPSLGSFSVSYQPAQLNSSTGTLDPKKPVLHFKDGPPATPDTGLIPFLASEMKISPASAANELLNFSLQVMSELVEHQRARLKGLGILTKDASGILHFEQENSSVAVQSSVTAGDTIPGPAPKVAPPAAVPTSATGTPSPALPVVNTTPGDIPVRAATSNMAPVGNSKLPPGQLDPTLDYAGLKSYQESPELSSIRQQLAQRREQVNSVFGDLREARERMKRVPLPGKEGSESAGSVPPAASSLPPTPKIPASNSSSSLPPRMPRSTTGTGRRPNPLLSTDPAPARQPLWPTEESTSLKRDSDALSGLPVEIPGRTSRPSVPPPVPPATGRRGTDPSFSPFDNTEPAAQRETWVPPPSNKSWRQPIPETPPPAPFSRTTPPPETGNVRDMRRSPLRKQPLPDFPPPPAENKTTRWPTQTNEPLPGNSFQLPQRFAEQEEADEEEVPRLGFFARIKEKVAGIFQRNREEELTTIVEEQLPDEEATGRIGGIFSKASAKFEEIRSNELDTSGEEKKDYWWIYSIFLASVATLALIIHLL